MIEPSKCASGTKDFIVVLTDGFIQVYSIAGLRNYPTRAVEVQLQTNVPLAFHLNTDARFFKLKKLIACSNDSLNHGDKLTDELSLLCLNKD